MIFTPLKNNKNKDSIAVDDIRIARITITLPVYQNDTRETCIDIARDCLYNYDEELVSVEIATPTLEELEIFSTQYGDQFISTGVGDLTLNEIIRKSKTSSSKSKKNRKNKV